MKISKKSWHYWYLNWVGIDHPKNLCNYFWMTILMLLGLPFFLISFTLCNFFDIVEKRPKKEPGLFRLWVRARKEKVCPLIEYVD